MADNDAIVETLNLKQLLITKVADSAAVTSVIFEAGITINAHTSVFRKVLVPTLPVNLQENVEQLWGDIEEWLKETYFNLALE